MITEKTKGKTERRFFGKPIQETTLFELALFSEMPDDVYQEINRRLSLALTYLENGAPNTTKDILGNFYIRQEA
jgi:hypothetical protein